MKKSILPVALVAAIALAVTGPAAAQTSVNMRDADIRAYIADAGRVTGRTFIIDARVQGKVTVISERPLSRSEYFEMFLATLRANGFVAVPTSNGAFRIQPLDNAASQPSRIGSAGANRNQFVTEIVRLRSIDAAAAIDSVRSLVSPQGSVSANRGSNAVVIVDFADNVRRVREVLRQLDTDRAATRVVALKNASAKEIAAALTALIGGGGGAGAPGSGGSGASVVAVESSNAVAIRGDAATVARLAAMAQDLDQKARNGQEIRVVFLENADAEQLLPVLQQLVGEPVTQPSTSPPLSSAASLSSGSSGGSTTGSTPAPTVAPAPAIAGATGGTGTPAITGIGGRTAAVITRFAGANAIVIAAPSDVQRQLADVIAKLDTRREQVLVEAIVAEVSDSTASRLGVQFLLAGLPGSGIPSAASTFSNTAPNLLTIAGAIGARELATTTTTVNGQTTVTSTNNAVSDSLAQSAVSSILSATGGFGGLATTIGKDAIFGSIINAVKSDTTSNLLQAPSVITLDNNEARILVGQEIPITTGQALSTNFDNAFRTVQRENVGIQLQVRPQVNSSGGIKLYLRQQVSSIAGPVSGDNSDLILNKREVETVLTVDDGQIAVIGGLLSDDERRTIEKIPLLGDIPGIGALFRSKARTRTKTNLMIFIRPTILRTAEDTRRVTEQRYGYLRLQISGQKPDEEPSIDQLVRDYLGTAPPIPSSPIPGNIDDPRITVPTIGGSSSTIIKAK
ncbi:type II secretion system secretin GspD [uncultured Sphingomonas sp.]|uniref:type II secretion system secretin GspD n=1 Tax=uncultured Sphingomonas sp. TaxID=158754 RepID=UPI0035CA8990